jgi:hypothetical protein
LTAWRTGNSDSAMPAVTAKAARGAVRGKKLPAARRKRALSAYELFKPYIGVISGPGDLSTNPKYMEGYGQSRRP